jgi:anti-sigma B factor antagonist
MAINIRVAGDLVVLSNFARLMNDPRHFDAAADVKAQLDQGHRNFALELRDVQSLGSSGVGLLITITRLIRQSGGDVVLVNPSRAMETLIEDMKLDTLWDVVRSVDEARSSLGRGSG